MKVSCNSIKCHYSKRNFTFRSSSPDVQSSALSWGTKLEHFETSYMEYLGAAREKIEQCMGSCSTWTAPYDGDNPSPDSLSADTPDDSTLPDLDVTPVVDKTIDSVFVNPVKKAEDHAESEKENTASSKSAAEHTEAGVDGISSLPNLPETTRGSGQRESYAESVTSEADSALSASSSNTDTVNHENPASRSDSPLNDNFDPTDFNAFLLSLKRVKTPVEFCDDIEDSFHEIDDLVNDLKRSKQGSSRESRPLSSELPNFTDTPSGTVFKPEANHVNDPSASHTGEAEENQKLADSLEEQGRPQSLSALPAADTPKRTLPPSAAFTPSRYSLGTPNIGKKVSSIIELLSLVRFEQT